MQKGRIDLKKWSKKTKAMVWTALAALLVAAVLAVVFLKPGAKGSAEGTVWVQNVGALNGLGASGSENYYAGVVETQETINIQRDTNRTLKDTYVQTGDTIQKGEPLFEYDSQESEMALEKAKIEEQQLENAVTSYQNQLATLQKQLGNANSTEEKLDLTEQVQTMEATISQTQYDLKVKQLEVEELEKNQQETVVKSPIDGVVKSVGSNNNYYDSGDSAYITLMSLGDYRVKCKINETNIGSVLEGDVVTVYSRVDSSQTWSGTIAQIETGAVEEESNDSGYYDEGSSGDEMTQSSNYAFYVTLDEEEGLLIGQHVYVKPGSADAAGSAEGEEVLTLPDYFIVQEENGDSYVWAANDRDQLEKRKVTLGAYDEMNCTYVIEDGLTASDYVAYPDPTYAGGEGVLYEEGMLYDSLSMETYAGEDGLDAAMPEGEDFPADDAFAEDGE